MYHRSIILISLMALSCNTLASCRTALPKAVAFAIPKNNSCPSGYYVSGTSCVPTHSRSSRYAFFNAGGSCPSGYYSSSKSCIATSEHSCYAFFNPDGNCPSGYYKSGNSCVAY